MYTTNRQLNINNASKKGDNYLFGDGRFNSPGYSARYDRCTVLDRNFELILDFNVSHIRIAGNLAHMELDRLKQVLEGFEGHGLPITSFTTDISKSVVTGVRGQNMKLWIKAIINHFLRCGTTSSGYAKELKEK